MSSKHSCLACSGNRPRCNTASNRLHLIIWERERKKLSQNLHEDVCVCVCIFIQKNIPHGMYTSYMRIYVISNRSCLLWSCWVLILSLLQFKCWLKALNFNSLTSMNRCEGLLCAAQNKICMFVLNKEVCDSRDVLGNDGCYKYSFLLKMQTNWQYFQPLAFQTSALEL